MKRTIDTPSDKDKDDKDRNNTWRYLCQIKELPPGKSQQFTIRDEKQSKIEIAVFNVEGKFHSISNTCKHEGGPLSQGILKGKVVTCPWHGWKYSIIDGKAPHKGGDSIDSYETKIINDEELYVNIIASNLGKRVTQPHESYRNLNSIKEYLNHMDKDAQLVTDLDKKINVLGISLNRESMEYRNKYLIQERRRDIEAERQLRAFCLHHSLL